MVGVEKGGGCKFHDELEHKTTKRYEAFSVQGDGTNEKVQTNEMLTPHGRKTHTPLKGSF
jgi:hypothetical protein